VKLKFKCKQINGKDVVNWCQEMQKCHDTVIVCKHFHGIKRMGGY
jgi:hypothetical protein